MTSDDCAFCSTGAWRERVCIGLGSFSGLHRERVFQRLCFPIWSRGLITLAHTPVDICISRNQSKNLVEHRPHSTYSSSSCTASCIEAQTPAHSTQHAIRSTHARCISTRRPCHPSPSPPAANQAFQHANQAFPTCQIGASYHHPPSLSRTPPLTISPRHAGPASTSRRQDARASRFRTVGLLGCGRGDRCGSEMMGLGSWRGWARCAAGGSGGAGLGRRVRV